MSEIIWYYLSHFQTFTEFSTMSQPMSWLVFGILHHAPTTLQLKLKAVIHIQWEQPALYHHFYHVNLKLSLQLHTLFCFYCLFCSRSILIYFKFNFLLCLLTEELSKHQSAFIQSIVHSINRLFTYVVSTELEGMFFKRCRFFSQIRDISAAIQTFW